MEFVKKFVNSHWFVIILLIILALLGFSTVLHGQFLYDDRTLIVENFLIRSLKNIPTFFLSGVARGANVLDTNLYRPIVNVIYTVLFSIAGLETFLYHIFNVAIHIVNSFLIFLFLRKLYFSRVGALIAASIFVIHPIQAESVGYVAGLPDILCTMFMLLGFNVFLNIDTEDENIYSRGKKIVLISVLLILAFLSKELAVVFAPILLALVIYKWRDYDGRTKEYIKKILYVIFGITLIYIFLKFTVLNFTGGSLSLNRNDDMYTESIVFRIITFLRMLPEYFRLIFWPVHLYFEKPNIGYTYFGWQGFVGLIVMVLGGVFAIISYMKKRVFMLAYFIFFLGLAPVSSILIIANFKYADHWLYVPIIGFLILIAAFYDCMKGRIAKNIFIVSSVIVIVLFGYRLSLRNAEWADPIAFFENEIKYFPSARVYNHLGFEYYQTLQMKKALEYFYKAIEFDDTYPHPHFHLGNFYYAGGNIPKALDEYYLGLKLAPNHVATISSVGIIADKLGEIEISDDLQLLLARMYSGEPITFDDIPPRGAFSQ